METAYLSCGHDWTGLQLFRYLCIRLDHEEGLTGLPNLHPHGRFEAIIARQIVWQG